jgi:hypothetical protein
MNNTQSQPTDRHYLHTYGAGAWLPFMQASITALIVTIAVWVLAWMIFDALDPHKPALVIGIVVWVWQWVKLQGHWFALTAVNHVINDLADDGRLNNSVQPEAQDEAPRIIRIQLIKDNGHIGETIDLPCDEEQLSTLAKGLINGLPFSEKFWTGRGKPFSTNQYRALKDAMMKRGLCEYVNETEPRQGIRLTDAGRAVMENFALPHSPTEEEEA